MQEEDPRPGLARLATPVAAAVLYFVFALLFLRMPLLNDSDSYYHLAVARSMPSTASSRASRGPASASSQAEATRNCCSTSS